MTRRHHRVRTAGFSLLELAVVVTIVAVLAGTLLKSILYYQEKAEAAAMDQVAAAVQAAVTMRAGQLQVRGDTAKIESMADENPMQWMAQVPANYLGELYFSQHPQLEAGNWYFDRSNRELVYVRDHGDRDEEGGLQKIRFKLHLLRENNLQSANGVVGGDNIPGGATEGVVLKKVVE